MRSMRTIIEEILAKKKINKVFFAACGGSLAAFYPAKYFLERESTALTRIGWYTANEFVHAAPKALDSESLVVICSHQGTTPETVKAGEVAKAAGAEIVAFTFAPDSAITELTDHVVIYSWGEGQIYSMKKEMLGLKLVMEFLHQTENWGGYDQAMKAFGIYDSLVDSAKEASAEAVSNFAEAYKDEKIIYTVGSGSSWCSAYMEAICILMEMQWIHSSSIHSGELLHGPLEITDEDVPFILLKSDGETRELDERAERFLKKYSRKVLVIDEKDLGLDAVDESVREYFCSPLFNIVIDDYNHALADKREHPLTTRRYMWKVEY